MCFCLSYVYVRLFFFSGLSPPPGWLSHCVHLFCVSHWTDLLIYAAVFLFTFAKSRQWFCAVLRIIYLFIVFGFPTRSRVIVFQSVDVTWLPDCPSKQTLSKLTCILLRAILKAQYNPTTVQPVHCHLVNRIYNVYSDKWLFLIRPLNDLIIKFKARKHGGGGVLGMRIDGHWFN